MSREVSARAFTASSGNQSTTLSVDSVISQNSSKLVFKTNKDSYTVEVDGHLQAKTLSLSEQNLLNGVPSSNSHNNGVWQPHPNPDAAKLATLDDTDASNPARFVVDNGANNRISLEPSASLSGGGAGPQIVMTRDFGSGDIRTFKAITELDVGETGANLISKRSVKGDLQARQFVFNTSHTDTSTQENSLHLTTVVIGGLPKQTLSLKSGTSTRKAIMSSDGLVQTNLLQTDSVNEDVIADGCIVDALINADANIVGTKIQDASIPTTKLTDSVAGRLLPSALPTNTVYTSDSHSVPASVLKANSAFPYDSVDSSTNYIQSNQIALEQINYQHLDRGMKGRLNDFAFHFDPDLNNSTDVTSLLPKTQQEKMFVGEDIAEELSMSTPAASVAVQFDSSNFASESAIPSTTVTDAEFDSSNFASESAIPSTTVTDAEFKQLSGISTASTIQAQLDGKRSLGAVHAGDLTGTVSRDRLPTDALFDGSTLNASNLSQGTVPRDRLPTDALFTNSTLNASNLGSGTLDVGRLPTEALTTSSNLDASKLTGTVSVDRLPTDALFDGSALNASNLSQGTVSRDRLPTDALFDGSALNASNLSEGTVPVARLPSVALFDGNAASLTGTLDKDRLPGNWNLNSFAPTSGDATPQTNAGYLGALDGQANYAIAQDADGQTYVNAAQSKTLNFRINNTTRAYINDGSTVFRNNVRFEDNGTITLPDNISANIGDLSITTAKLEDRCVTSAKLASQAVTSAKLAANCVTSAKLADAAVSRRQLSLGSSVYAIWAEEAGDLGLTGSGNNLTNRTVQRDEWSFGNGRETTNSVPGGGVTICFRSRLIGLSLNVGDGLSGGAFSVTVQALKNGYPNPDTTAGWIASITASNVTNLGSSYWDGSATAASNANLVYEAGDVIGFRTAETTNANRTDRGIVTAWFQTIE